MLTVRYSNGEQRFPIPFVTIHRVVDGRVTERLDFGEYIETFDLGDAFDANTSSTKEVADRALQAYLDGDLETTREVSDPDIQFQDPTSKVFGPPSGELYQGRDELLRRRTQIYENIKGFNLEVETSFVANHHAVYMGQTTYTIANGTKFRQPAVFVFEVRGGKVTRQWDFVDYTVGPVEG
jgi:ketosteroid isomerase-like protein